MTVAFFIHPNYPYLAASPDGIVVDDCCGRGVLECKCPFGSRHGNVTGVSYLYCDSNNTIHLDRKHPYFFQVQGQMNVCDVSYADFVVWTVKECIVVRVDYDESFCRQMCEKLMKTLKFVILPCLLTNVNVHKCKPLDEN